MASLSTMHPAEVQGAGTHVPVYFLPDDTFRTPELEQLDGLWHSKAVGGLLPARSAFDLRELKTVLSHLVIMDVTRHDGLTRFFVRFMGSELDSQITPMTGHFADEILPADFRGKWQALWCRAMEFRHPTRSLSRAAFRLREYAYVESLFAPLSDDGVTQTKMMAAVIYHQLDVGSPRMRTLAQELKLEFDSFADRDVERF